MSRRPPEQRMSEWDPEEDFDQELADSCVGKYVLIGLTYVDSDGEVIDQIQMHEEYLLPPYLDAFDSAADGIYRLRSTGESIENPDFLASWTVRRPLQS